MRRTHFCVWLPFGELVRHETDLTGPYFAKGPGNPDWWLGRAELLSRFTLPSLLNQKFRFDVWAGIAEETADICGPVRDVLMEAGAKVVYHPARPNIVYGKTVAREAVAQALDGYDAVMFAQVDADDMYLDDALKLMAEHTPKPGLVLTLRKGYYLNAETMEMRWCDTGLCPPPFFGRVYTEEWKAHPEAYEALWNFRVHHQDLLKSPNRVDIDHGRFVYVFHDRNTTGRWQRLVDKGNLGRVVDENERADVLRRCGQ